MELFLVPALVVWSASGNTGVSGKKLHLRILLGGRTGFKRNNHHKCSISQTQLILQAGFLFTDSPQQGGTNIVFDNKVQPQGSTRGALLALPKTEEHTWKTCPMENMPAIYSSGPHNQTLLSMATIYATKFPATLNILQCNWGTGRSSVNSSGKWQPKPELSQMVPFSAAHDKQTF